MMANANMIMSKARQAPPGAKAAPGAPPGPISHTGMPGMPNPGLPNNAMPGLPNPTMPNPVSNPVRILTNINPMLPA